jgi:hypothetical protein
MKWCQAAQDGHVESKFQSLVTDQVSICNEFNSGYISYFVKDAKTLTVPLGNTSPSHSSDQDGEL